jgi:hypothetical protein
MTTTEKSRFTRNMAIYAVIISALGGAAGYGASQALQMARVDNTAKKVEVHEALLTNVDSRTRGLELSRAETAKDISELKRTQERFAMVETRIGMLELVGRDTAKDIAHIKDGMNEIKTILKTRNP